MGKSLYLVRHGQTLFNQQHKIQGWCDSPLTQQGIYEAQTVRRYFQWQQIHFDQAYCSTAERTADTLELITDQPYTRLKGLKEWHFGRLEGESDVINPPLPYRDFFVAYGGEDEKDFQKRTADTCLGLMKTGGSTVLAVTHGAFCGQFRKFWDHTSKEADRLNGRSAKIGNCCIFTYRYCNGEFYLDDIINHEEQIKRMKGWKKWTIQN